MAWCWRSLTPFLLLALCSVTSLLAVQSNTCSKTVLFLPLDERYTTRQAFLNLAELTDFCILSPDMDILPSLKQPGDLDKIHSWVDANIPHADAMIISAEMYLYGGLIASRISNDTSSVIEHRAQKLLQYSEDYPYLEMYVSNVVMRIPSYNGDFEEPWYWDDYGYDLYTFSFYSDKYNQLNDPQDLWKAKVAVSGVPSSAVDEFTWRRERNHNITMLFLDRMKAKPSPFKYFYTTLDDSAEYGFNIREAEEIRAVVEEGALARQCPVYPGADEVQLTMLARYSVLSTQPSPSSSSSSLSSATIPLCVSYRDPSTTSSIPGYEGQPMVDTLEQQVAAAGGVVVSSDSDTSSCDVYLLVNNFSEDEQLEASQQPSNSDPELYSCFDSVIAEAWVGRSRPAPVGFADNRYANGADLSFLQYMANRTAHTSFQQSAYAGWNTNGNTLGTVIANTVLLSIFGESRDQPNAVFNSLRLLEDGDYQADVRQQLVAYVDQVTNTDETSSYLTPDLTFYERYIDKVLSSRYTEIASTYGLPWSFSSSYFPWNRTFEVGLSLT
mmetsp:Transcript_26345/g.44472  ORF Transcript_26345/g.44472 Transcript_26345/m.44472 type:complete len:554 (-) Transcript_26345:389-2050(-)